MTENSVENAIERYSDMVFRLAYARTLNFFDAEDVYQEIFLRLAEKNPDFKSEEHRKAWLIRVTVNCASNLHKQKLKSIPSENIEIPEYDNAEIEINAELICALKQLPEKYREVIHLFYFEDLSVAHISVALKRPKSTVLSQLSRARKKLAEFLKEE